MQLRPYRAGDVTACAAVIDAAIDGMVDHDAPTRALLRAQLAPQLLHAELGGYHTVVAIDDEDRIAGLAALHGDEVRRVYVHPRAQGTGLGRTLMQALEDEARRRGLHAVHLSAGLSASSFYDRLGYERLETGTFVSGEARVPFVKMRKRLDE